MLDIDFTFILFWEREGFGHNPSKLITEDVSVSFVERVDSCHLRGGSFRTAKSVLVTHIRSYKPCYLRTHVLIYAPWQQPTLSTVALLS